MPSLSVVIPTHKRAPILSLCLDHLAAQSVADQLEVIVVSDGHDEGTADLFFDPKWTKLAIQFLEVPKSQQGVARNDGVKQASAPITLFIGDDIFLEPSACERHLNVHNKRSRLTAHSSPLGVVGFTTWDPAVGITPVMRWLEKSGWQFGYAQLRAYEHRLLPTARQHQFTYASHISLPTKVARDHPFREDMTLYGWEDIEWGVRLRSAGVRLFYEPDAKARHHHHITLEQSLKRMEVLGESSAILARQGIDFGFRFSAKQAILYYLSLVFPFGFSMRHRRAFLRSAYRRLWSKH